MIDCYINKNVKLNKRIKEKFILDLRKSFSEMKQKKECKRIIFLCVGTDKVIGDCLGPIVGTKLTKYIKKYSNYNYVPASGYDIRVYGTLNNNINYENINAILKKLNHDDGIIVIDAAFSSENNIGKIFISNRKTTLGEGLKKELIQIGDISIKTVVAKDYIEPINNFNELQNISLNMILNLSDIIYEGIKTAIL